MTGQMSASARTRLGVTQCDLAAFLGCSERTIRRIERGEGIPLPVFQRLLRDVVASRPAKATIKTYRINAASMWRYLGPTRGWQHWPWHRRGRWLRWSRFYKQAQRDEQLGRARIVYTLHRRGQPQPAAALLDLAPDLDRE